MFSIFHQCDDFIVINKNAGISVHKDDNDQALLSEVAQQSGDRQLYLIHRLDKMTTGLLLLGRHKAAASELSKLFADRNVAKFYLALSAKKPNKKQGLICGDMEKSRRSAWKLMSTRKNPAKTQFFSTADGSGKRLFLCKPHTGKTHQIRVALKSLGAPILGDETYGGKSADRGYLHAMGLLFRYKDETHHFLLPPEEGDLWPDIPAEWLEPWLLNWPTIK